MEVLRYWQKDTDLVSIRDQAALAQLPTDEQQELIRFWANVEATLQQSEKSPGPQEEK